jgi:hypothetical protein
VFLVADAVVTPAEARQRDSFLRYVGVSARYAEEGRAGLISLAVTRQSNGSAVRVELTPGPRRTEGGAGTCVVVLRS